MNRGAVRKHSSKMLVLWVPPCLIPAIDQGVGILDLDRSKFVRLAIREKLAALGIDSSSTGNPERN